MKLATALGVSFAVKAVDDTARTFKGLASTWERDLGDDVIHKGAFKRTLDNWATAKNAIPLLDSHDRFSVDSILGKLLGGVEADIGLETEFHMRDTLKARDALAAVAGGFVDGLSIGYEPVKFEYETTEKGRVRHLTEVKLREISLVVFPMNEGARTNAASVKSLLDAARAGTLTDEERDELRALLSAPPAPADEPPADTPKGLAPDDPRRIALSANLRGLKLRSLTL